MILCQLEVEILPKLDFHGGHLKKMAETHIAPHANNIHRKPLIKMERDWGAW